MVPETELTLADLIKCFPKDVSYQDPEKIEYPVVLYQDHSETIRYPCILYFSELALIDF